MTTRDRIVLMVIVVVAVIAGGWIKLVSPERQKASKLNAQVATANSQLVSAEDKLASARASQSQYPAAYATMVNLGKAVPPSQEVPSLIYQLSQASTHKRVDFTSISTGGGTGSGSSTVTAPAAGTASASATTSALTQLPFTFVFEGSFFDLEHLLRELTSFTTRSSAGTLQVNGRLLTIQSVKLGPANSGSENATGWLNGSITATAYTAPASEGLVGAATTTAPTGSATSAASSTGTSSSPTAPAVVRVNP